LQDWDHSEFSPQLSLEPLSAVKEEKVHSSHLRIEISSWPPIYQDQDPTPKISASCSQYQKSEISENPEKKKNMKI
jgi:hypothetical protein